MLNADYMHKLFGWAEGKGLWWNIFALVSCIVLIGLGIFLDRKKKTNTKEIALAGMLTGVGYLVSWLFYKFININALGTKFSLQGALMFGLIIGCILGSSYGAICAFTIDMLLILTGAINGNVAFGFTLGAVMMGFGGGFIGKYKGKLQYLKMLAAIFVMYAVVKLFLQPVSLYYMGWFTFGKFTTIWLPLVFAKLVFEAGLTFVLLVPMLSISKQIFKNDPIIYKKQKYEKISS